MTALATRRIALFGAGGGIGSALARRLDAAGAQLLLLGRSRSALEALAESLGPETRTLALDLTDPAALGELPRRVQQRFGAIDTLIHCAGSNSFGPLETLAPETVQSILATNLSGPILATRALLPMLLEHDRPQLVLIGSALGWLGYPGQAVYCASKAGLARFGEAVRREYRATGLAVIHVAPRATRTPFNDPAQQAMNRRLKVAEDEPGKVAASITRAMQKGRSDSVLGFPERFAARLNQWFPALFDRLFAAHAEVMHEEYKRALRAPR